VFDDGGGPELYVGGEFASAGGMTTGTIAKWNGSNWSSLGSGASSFLINALGVYDDGGGPALYAGGSGSVSGVAGTNEIAKWDGSIWSSLSGGMTTNSNEVDALITFDDGGGTALYASGSFTTASGAAAKNIAKWDGSSWIALGNSVNTYARTLHAFDDGHGPALYAGGLFTDAIDSGDSFVAKWGNPVGCGSPGASICAPGTSGVMACPCGNPPTNGSSGCNNSSFTGGAELAATGIARLSYDTVVFNTSGERPTATSIVLQGNSVLANGAVFGQGVRCAGGILKRLYAKQAAAGSITAPQGADLHVHAQSAALGDPITPGSHRYYGVYYRDPNVLGGCPGSSTFNITQQLDVLWGA
jgi:hypothetical protein